ncbi:MAG: hypothetical protein NTV72_02835 [Candidatus Taylorbacteria bacterium]|nr:hypothetical protein [Candidatus Taylorbacteria bacterium]
MDVASYFDVGKIVALAPELLKSAPPYIIEGAARIYGIIVMISIPASVALLFGIFYSHFGAKAVEKKADEKFAAHVEMANNEKAKGNSEHTNRWKKILEMVSSANQSDWIRSIIEADIMLDEVLEKAGYQGEGIGEKLKRVEKGDLQSLDSAWEAHKVRNAIAHEPNFALNQHEAKRVIELYRKVFAEYYVI